MITPTIHFAASTIEVTDFGEAIEISGLASYRDTLGGIRVVPTVVVSYPHQRHYTLPAEDLCTGRASVLADQERAYTRLHSWSVEARKNTRLSRRQAKALLIASQERLDQIALAAWKIFQSTPVGDSSTVA